MSIEAVTRLENSFVGQIVIHLPNLLVNLGTLPAINTDRPVYSMDHFRIEASFELGELFKIEIIRIEENYFGARTHLVPAYGEPSFPEGFFQSQNKLVSTAVWGLVEFMKNTDLGTF